MVRALRQTRMRRSAPIKSAVLCRRPVISGDGLDVSLISTAQRFVPPSSTRSSSKPSEVRKKKGSRALAVGGQDGQGLFNDEPFPAVPDPGLRDKLVHAVGAPKKIHQPGVAPEYFGGLDQALADMGKVRLQPADEKSPSR